MADYYDLLGVPKDASAEQIKRAYRKQALKYHPDRNQGSGEAEELFKEATRAYETLKDPDQRARYDRFGEAGVSGGGATGQRGFGFDMNAALEVFLRDFGGAGMGGFGDIFDPGGSYRRDRSGVERGETMRIRLRLKLADVVTGVTRQLRLALLERCRTCSGSGSSTGARSVCTVCEGRGEIRRLQRSIVGQMVTVQPCRSCGGEGRVVSDPCRECSGEGRKRESRTLEVEVPPGVGSENFLTLKERGSVGRGGGPRGDIVVMLHVEDDPRFERDGTMLIHEVAVTFSTAALGREMEVPTLDGPAKVTVPAGVQSGDTLRLKGLGLPELQGRNRGDQLLKVRVWTPEQLSPEQERLFRELSELEGSPPVPGAGPRVIKGFWERVKGALSGN
ncbi:MAG: J domain-containing protein [Gemmatimonadetes bacterium]|nr:J domain-containing protein [Gemmatimonadota bacterium]